MSIVEFLNKHSKQAEIAGYLIIIIVGLMDFLLGQYVVFSFFFIVPVIMVAASKGFARAVPLILGATVFWFAAEYQIYNAMNVPTAFLISNGILRLLFYLTFAYMAYQLKEVLAREVRDGRLDKLTGLANRKGFYEQVEIELERQSRYGHPIAVAYIDIDDLKQINDSLGHSEGDRVIQAIGGVFSSSIRVMDIAARIGGDEFAIVFPELDIESAEKATQKIRSALGGVRTSLGPVKASIGVAIFATSPDSVDDMLRAADRIMYSVKNAEKDAVRIGIA